MNKKLFRLGAALSLALLLVGSLACSSGSKSDASTGPTAPEMPQEMPEAEAGPTGVQLLGLTGGSFSYRHDAFESESDSDADTDGDSDGDSDVDSDADTDGDSDVDSDADTDGDSDVDSDADTDVDSDGDTDGDSDVDSDGDTDDDSDSDDGCDNSGPGNCDDGMSPSASGFDGRLAGVGPDGTLQLNDGTRVGVDAATFWEPNGDLFSIPAIEAALGRGQRVKVEGHGSLTADGTLLASTIRAQSNRNRRGRDDRSDDDIEDDFEGQADEFRGRVDATDASGRVLLLRSGRVVVVGDANWDPRGDLFSFRQVARAVDRGERVRVEGFGVRNDDGTIDAHEIKAETDGRGAGDGPGDDEFESAVIGVDPARGLLFLANGLTIVVNASTIWDPLGDLFSLDAAATAVALGRPVRAEGDGALQADGTVLALTLKVEVDD